MMVDSTALATCSAAREAAFLPDPSAALASDPRIRAHLDESVGAIVEALSDATGWPIARPVVPALPGPLVYAAYFELLEVVLADEVEASVDRLERFAKVAGAAVGPFVKAWAAFDPYDQGLMSRFLNSDASTRIDLRSPSEDHSSSAIEAVTQAFSLFDAAAPDIAGEIRALIRQVILVTGSVNGELAFDGASCFDFWGALFLNAERYATRIEAIDGLSHESAHAVLFGLADGAPFVENPDDERHASPLREDLRPLDGIFHATFVSARMVYAHQRVLASGLLLPEEVAASERRLETSRAAFDDGHATLSRHAHLTSQGRALLDAATRFMQAREHGVSAFAGCPA